MARIPITVLLPIKNGEVHIDRIMTEVVACTNSLDEILVLDDFSTDKTLSKLATWQLNYPHVRVLKSIKPGLVNTLNYGLSEARNLWIARFDCDDSYPPERLDMQTKLIQPGVSAIFSDYEMREKNLQSYGRFLSPIDPNATRLSLWRNARTPHPSVMFNKDNALQVGGYLEQDYLAEDLSLWLRLSRVGNLVSCPKVLLIYNLSPNSITGSKYKESKAKAREIYEDSGVDLGVLVNSINNFESLQKVYLNYDLPKERTFLAYVDILANAKIMKLSPFTTLKFAIRHFCFSYIALGFRTLWGINQRRLARKIRAICFQFVPMR